MKNHSLILLRYYSSHGKTQVLSPVLLLHAQHETFEVRMQNKSATMPSVNCTNVILYVERIYENGQSFVERSLCDGFTTVL